MKPINVLRLTVDFPAPRHRGLWHHIGTLIVDIGIWILHGYNRKYEFPTPIQVEGGKK